MSAQNRQSGSSSSNTPAPSLDQIQARSERLSEWIADNPIAILGTAAVVLLVAAIWGLVASSQEESNDEAATALAAAQNEFRADMGAEPGTFQISEPANPETARQARESAANRFQEVIDAHAGTSAAALAALERGQLLLDLGRADEAIAAWQEAAQGADTALASFLQQRIAGVHEDAGRFSDAAAAYEAAAGSGFALSPQALADAARCRAEAGEEEAAVALLQRVEAEAPDFVIPAHIAARLRELRASTEL